VWGVRRRAHDVGETRRKAHRSVGTRPGRVAHDPKASPGFDRGGYRLPARAEHWRRVVARFDVPAGGRRIGKIVRVQHSMIPKSGYRFSEQIMLKQHSMISKSGYRFSEQIMLKQTEGTKMIDVIRELKVDELEQVSGGLSWSDVVSCYNAVFGSGSTFRAIRKWL